MRSIAFKWIACCGLLIASGARAQTLAERVPGDAIAYLGWKGADTADNGYAGSHLQAIIDASGWADVRDQVIPQLMHKITASSNDHGEGALAAKTTLNILWRHPSAVFFAGMNYSGKEPRPRIGLLCRAGNDGDALMTILNAAMHGLDADPSSRAFVSGDCTVFTLGYADQSAIPGDADKSKSLSADADFERMLTATDKDGLVSGYVDATRGFAQIDEAVAKYADDEAKQIWPKLRDSSGLMGLKRLAYSAGFSGKDWTSASFIEAPSPRSGLLKVIEPAPIDSALLSRVPTSAASSLLGTLDLGEFFRQVRTIVATAVPDGALNFDRAMGVAQMFIGRSLQHDIIEPLGSQWVMYTDSSIPFSTLTPATQPAMEGNNLVIVNKLVDPAKALQGWTMLSYAINNSLGRFKRAPGSKISTAMTQNGNDTVFTVNTPFAQPSWTIHDGYLYLGFSGPGVIAAANGAASTTLATQVPAFADLAKQLTPSAFSNFQYANLPVSIPQEYPKYEQALQMVRSQVQSESITLPEKILPPLEKVIPELTPALSLSWADDSGWHSKSRSPFPGASPQPATFLVGSGALGASVLLPSLNRSRETANRIKCASNERQIGQAMLLYANDHKGNYPAKLSDLLEEEITADVFVCPAGTTSVSAEIRNLPHPDLVKWIEAHSDYVYVAAGLTSSSGAEEIMVYEKPNDHGKDGINILFGDGHVEFVKMGRAVAMINDQNKTVPTVELPEVPEK